MYLNTRMLNIMKQDVFVLCLFPGPLHCDPPTLFVSFPKTSVTHCLLADFNIILYNSTKISMERGLAIAPDSFLVDIVTTASKLKISSRSVTVGTTRPKRLLENP